MGPKKGVTSLNLVGVLVPGAFVNNTGVDATGAPG